MFRRQERKFQDQRSLGGVLQERTPWMGAKRGHDRPRQVVSQQWFQCEKAHTYSTFLIPLQKHRKKLAFFFSLAPTLLVFWIDWADVEGVCSFGRLTSGHQFNVDTC
jgi:hypothetical protein